MDMPQKPLVILVHGIRDFARWQATIADTLKKAGFDVEPTNYGRMNLLEFLVPIPYFRKRAVARVWDQIQYAQSLHPGAELSILAHSFGTYIVAHILQNKSLRADKIIFCGSVLPFDFPFKNINDRFDAPVLNEVGTADVWPAVAESVTTGYGSAGTYGFRTPGVKDRFHNGARHGYFLSREFCAKFWIPFLRSEPDVLPGDLPPEDPPGWVQLLSIVKLKYVMVLILLILLVWAFGGQYAKAVWCSFGDKLSKGC